MTPEDENTITYISGVDASGRVAATSYHTWTSYDPTRAFAVKWGPPIAGTGATVTYAFDAASNWDETEQAGFITAMHLWQAEANIHFVPLSPDSGESADLTMIRISDGLSHALWAGEYDPVGSSVLPTFSPGQGGVAINTDVYGAIGEAFSVSGGYPWDTIIHELGHSIGLGHAGPYNDITDMALPPAPDDRAHSIMSYWTPKDAIWSTISGYTSAPLTPMALDIAAVQRLYGAPVDSPLGDGTIFGFHTNIQGDIAKFFDFTVDTLPIVTLFSTGVGNTLDLTGYAMASTVDLNEGAMSSVGGLTENLSIAYGTRIDTLLLGSGNDSAWANGDHDVIMGGGGADLLIGGAGNDHLYGAGTSQTPNDGADTIDGGAGGDYIQGNGGDDQLYGGGGGDRVYGGAGNDLLHGGDGNDTVNSNLGDDHILGDDGNDLLRGGQGNDKIEGGAGADIVMGDLGNDIVIGGAGIDAVYGGLGADYFAYEAGDAHYAVDGAGAWQLDAILDYQDGTDRIWRIDIGQPHAIVHLGAMASVQAADAAARTAGGGDGVWVASVGSDAVILFRQQDGDMGGIRVAGLSDTAINPDDFL